MGFFLRNSCTSLGVCVVICPAIPASGSTWGALVVHPLPGYFRRGNQRFHKYMSNTESRESAGTSRGPSPASSCERRQPGLARRAGPVSWRRGHVERGSLACNYFRAPAMNGWQPTPVTPAGEDAPAEVDLARFQAERDASQRRQERITSMCACLTLAYDGSAFCLAAFCLASGPPGYGGDRRVSLVQRLRCPGGRITALGGQRQAMHERPGQRQGDSEQQPHPQAPGEKCPHVQGPFVVPREVLWLPALSRPNLVPRRPATPVAHGDPGG